MKNLNSIPKSYNNKYHNVDYQRGKFILYEKYTRRDVCHLLNWGKDLSAIMFGKMRVNDDVTLFVTYHKEEAEEGEYLDGKPDYADEFLNNQIFLWDSKIRNGPDSSYMDDVREAKNKHLFVKKVMQ